MPGLATSASVIVDTGAPKTARALSTAMAFSDEASTQMSRSLVQSWLGVKGDRVAANHQGSGPQRCFNAENRSLKSGFTGIGRSPRNILAHQIPHLRQALFWWHGVPIFAVQAIRILQRTNLKNDAPRR